MNTKQERVLRSGWGGRHMGRDKNGDGGGRGNTKYKARRHKTKYALNKRKKPTMLSTKSTNYDHLPYIL